MKILAYIEQRNGELKKNAYEVLSTARNLAGSTGGSFTTLLIGDSVATLADGLGEYGATDVVLVEDSRLAGFASGAWATAITSVARAEGADVVLLSNTSHGKDLAPKVAIRLEAGLAPDVMALTAEGSELAATRPVFAGKAQVDVKINTPVKVFSLRPNVFTPSKA